jgi:tRNA A58 N-methylase Trm61
VDSNVTNPERLLFLGNFNDDFPQIMRAMNITPPEHVFVDFGAGMGRVMILAAMHPFQRVLGVELVPELVEIAKKNIEACRAKLSCKDLQIEAIDVTKYDIPPDASILYFYNPFAGAILDEVILKIQRLMSTSQKPTLVVCNVPQGSQFDTQIRKTPFLKLLNESHLSGDRICLIFESSGHYVGDSLHV